MKKHLFTILIGAASMVASRPSRAQNIVATQKQGLSVRYTLRDPLVGDLLDVARRIFNNHLVSTRGLLRELQRESRRG